MRSFVRRERCDALAVSHLHAMESIMQFHFHVHTGDGIEYDTQGAQFDDVEDAKAFGLQLIRNYFLLHPNPKPGVLERSVLCITHASGYVEPLPFLDAFRNNDDQPIVYCTPGHA